MTGLHRILVAAVAVAVTAPALADECVVLLHGLGRTERSMRALEETLGDAGYAVVNDGYPSRKLPIAELAPLAVGNGIERCQQHKAERIHFVTHSMGGILVRVFAAEEEDADIDRVVMIGPPNNGSEVVDAVRGWPGYGLLNGKAGHELGTDSDSVPLNLGPADFDVGVIAGSRTLNPILSQFLPNPDDGKVSVESARLDGMRDFIVMPHSHPFIAQRKPVIEQVLHYLRTGEFDHDAL